MKSTDLLNNKITVKIGDITKEQCDAIINAANSSLLGGGGVDGAIHHAGGHQILNECRQIRKTQYPEGIPTGECVITQAGHLPCRYIIHTVGPIWKGGNANEANLLHQSYYNSMKKALEYKLETIAFPAISTGVYGYPRELAAAIAFNTIKSFLLNNTFPKKVIFIFFSNDDYHLFLNSIQHIH